MKSLTCLACVVALLCLFCITCAPANACPPVAVQALGQPVVVQSHCQAVQVQSVPVQVQHVQVQAVHPLAVQTYSVQPLVVQAVPAAAVQVLAVDHCGGACVSSRSVVVQRQGLFSRIRARRAQSRSLTIQRTIIR